MIKRVIIKYQLECLTGLQIQAGNSTFDIGGIDNPIVRDPVSKAPYIPGSSLKGKLRSLLEWAEEPQRILCSGGDVINDPDTLPGKLFGVAPGNEDYSKNITTRVIIRDAHLSDESREVLNRELGENVYTEVKWENNIRRLTSKATPRVLERVPRGAIFNGEIIISIFEEDNEELLIEGLLKSMRLLEDNYLGGSGSRGSGQVKFKEVKFAEKNVADYAKADNSLEFELLKL